ncbi:MAG: hypothetical protein K1060chlam2_00122 [Chlamydiae bacterium]|nr:hypothetical protein [Chlamydiota bacterium]
MRKKRPFGELEATILSLFRDGKQRLSVKEVQAVIGNKTAYTTIMTVMSRLYEKGSLGRIKVGRSYLYSLKKSRFSILRELKSKLIGVRPSEFLSCFLEDQEKLDPAELKKIEQMLRDYKRKPWK